MYRGVFGMKYNVGESYPSVGYITGMVVHMSGLGWRRLDYDFIVSKNRLNHALGSNGEWDEYTDEKGRKVESWIDDWEDASGNIVRYNLKYRIGANENKQMSSDLEVVATYIPENIKEKISSSFTSTLSFD